MKILLGWPDKKLSPNARLHWKAKLAPKKIAKDAAWMATITTPGFCDTAKSLVAGNGPINVSFTFYPPDRRLRDDDNMIASVKAARDGIASALGVDDNRFRASYHFEEPEKPGRVEVEIEL